MGICSSEFPLQRFLQGNEKVCSTSGTWRPASESRPSLGGLLQNHPRSGEGWLMTRQCLGQVGQAEGLGAKACMGGPKVPHAHPLLVPWALALPGCTGGSRVGKLGGRHLQCTNHPNTCPQENLDKCLRGKQAGSPLPLLSSQCTSPLPLCDSL